MKGKPLTPICPYCDKFSEPQSGLDIYPHRPDLVNKRFFRCVPCDAYVGTHASNGKPLGTLANAALRRARNSAHASFDPLWKHNEFPRSTAYKMLALGLGISTQECHVGMFTEEQCKQTVDLCNSGRIFEYETDARSQDQKTDKGSS